jgi:putative hydrolase of the HAD superfamily
MTSMNSVKAVLFDYGMVLSGPADPLAWSLMRTISGLTEDDLHRGYWAHRHAYDRGDLTGHAYWKNVGSDAGISFTTTQIRDLIAADLDLWGQLNPLMLEWAQSLQRAGFPTGILSNIGDAMSAGLLARFDWLANFNHCTWSHTLNLAKPEPAIYLSTAASLQTPPPNILFIDDRLENVQAALATGMQAIQYLDHSTFEQEMHSRGLAGLLTLTTAARD